MRTIAVALVAVACAPRGPQVGTPQAATGPVLEPVLPIVDAGTVRDHREEFGHTAPAVVDEQPEPAGTLRITGRVVDAGSGRALAGAIVTLRARAERTAVTASDGSFRFDGLGPRRYSLWATTEVLATPRVTALLDDARAIDLRTPSGSAAPPTFVGLAIDVVLRARPTEPVEVRVVDSKGAPVATARVLANRRWRPVDARGGVVLRGLPRLEPDQPALWAAAPGYAATRIDGDFGRLPRETTVTLRRGAPVSGTAHAFDGSPLPGALVRVTARVGESTWVGYSRADRNGAWHLDAVPAGRLQIAASRIYNYGAIRELASDGTTPLAGLDVTAPADHIISGTVVDRAGDPVADADVLLSDDVESFEISTDARGRFEAHGLAEKAITVIARAGRRSSAAAGVDLRAGTTPIRLTLEDAMIAGQVVDADGRPLADAVVFGGDAYDDSALVGGVVEKFHPEAPPQWAITDATGRFELGPVPHGRYALSANRLDDHDFAAFPRTAAFSPSSGVALAVHEAGALTGQVVFANAPASCDVEIIQHAYAQQRERCFHGTFTATGVAPGEYTVLVRGGFAPITRTVKIANTALTDLGTLVADSGRLIAGRVVDGDGKPIANAKVLVAPHVTRYIHRDLAYSYPDLYTDTSGPDGSFAIDDVDPAARDFEIIAVLGSGRTAMTSAVQTVGAGMQRDLELRLTGDGHVDVTLRKMKPGVRYTVWFYAGDQPMGHTYSPGSAAPLAVMPPGRYRVAVARADDVPPERASGRELTVRDGVITTLVLPAPP